MPKTTNTAICKADTIIDERLFFVENRFITKCRPNNQSINTPRESLKIETNKK